jgi:hypothetical protein
MSDRMTFLCRMHLDPLLGLRGRPRHWVVTLFGIVCGGCKYITMRSYTSIVYTSTLAIRYVGNTSSAFLVQCARSRVEIN